MSTSFRPQIFENHAQLPKNLHFTSLASVTNFTGTNFFEKISHTLTAPSASEFPDVSGKTVGCKQPMRSWEINTSQKMPLSRQLQLHGLFFVERFDPKICNIMLCNHGLPDSFLDDSVVSLLKMFRSQIDKGILLTTREQHNLCCPKLASNSQGTVSLCWC